MNKLLTAGAVSLSLAFGALAAVPALAQAPAAAPAAAQAPAAAPAATPAQ